MIITSSAIVIKTFPFKESSTIVCLFTRDFGLKSYIIKGGRKYRSSVRSNIFQPLQVMDIVCYNNHKNALNTLKECSLQKDLSKMRSSIIKISLVFFITEIISLSLKEDNPNPNVFDFIVYSIDTLNNGEDSELKDFHLYFLYHFASLLGFQPLDDYGETNPYFDFTKGSFFGTMNETCFSIESSREFHKYFNFVSDKYEVYTSSSYQRKMLLNNFAIFYYEHITSQKPIRSIEILHTIL